MREFSYFHNEIQRKYFRIIFQKTPENCFQREF